MLHFGAWATRHSLGEYGVSSTIGLSPESPPIQAKPHHS